MPFTEVCFFKNYTVKTTSHQINYVKFESLFKNVLLNKLKELYICSLLDDMNNN